MSKTDPGLERVSRLAALLQIDDKWSVRSKRGFTWWSYRLAQHIEAGRPKLINGQSVSLVHVYTELLQQVPDSGPAIALAGLANGRETLNAVVFDPTKKTLSECCTALVHEGNLGWMDRLLGFAAILQNTAAHSRAHAAAEATKATIAQSTHPVSGERPAIDEILGVAQAAAATGQSRPSAFAGGLISALPDFAKSFGFLGFGDASGFSCEVPFSADPAVPLSSAAGGDGTSILHRAAAPGLWHRRALHSQGSGPIRASQRRLECGEPPQSRGEQGKVNHFALWSVDSDRFRPAIWRCLFVLRPK